MLKNKYIFRYTTSRYIYSGITYNIVIVVKICLCLCYNITDAFSYFI